MEYILSLPGSSDEFHLVHWVFLLFLTNLYFLQRQNYLVLSESFRDPQNIIKFSVFTRKGFEGNLLCLSPPH